MAKQKSKKKRSKSKKNIAKKRRSLFLPLLLFIVIAITGAATTYLIFLNPGSQAPAIDRGAKKLPKKQSSTLATPAPPTLPPPITYEEKTRPPYTCPTSLSPQNTKKQNQQTKQRSQRSPLLSMILAITYPRPKKLIDLDMPVTLSFSPPRPTHRDAT